MSKPTRASHPAYGLLPIEIEGFDSLAELALDMRWSWNHATDELWRQLDLHLWETTHNPWVVLQTVSRDKIEHALADPAFRENVDGMVNTRRHELESPAWFGQNHSQAALTCAAYFSMEFMLSEALPIYSGGLGNVAGDQLKATSDLGVPVVGVGLLYQQGYFRQVIDKDGTQQALYPYNDPGQLPVVPLRQPDGEWLRLEIALPGYSVWLRAWQVQVGRVKLYLLDSNDPANIPADRGITSELYGGGPELRLKQELLLGIGGWRLLRALSIAPEVCHLNEGHAAFAVLERACSFMADTGQPFEVALAVTRAGNLFTTHTAVAAGFDRFEPALIEQYLGGYAEQKLHIALQDLLALGREDPTDASEPFNMAYLAIHGSGAVNGVSRLHGSVSRHLFQSLFPRWPEDEVPVGHVTNGVHMPTWDSAPADDLWTEACGKDRWLGTMESMVRDVRRIPDARLWHFRRAASEALVAYARERSPRHLEASGASPEAVDEARRLFDPNALTLGFARRFATYKRPNLLLHYGPSAELVDGFIRDPEAYPSELAGVIHSLRSSLTRGSVPGTTEEGRRRDRAMDMLRRISSVSRARMAAISARNAGRTTAWSDDDARAWTIVVGLANDVAEEVYYGSGSYDASKLTGPTTPTPLLRRFYAEGKDLLEEVALIPWPAATHHVMQTLERLISVDPLGVLRLARATVLAGESAGYGIEQLGLSTTVSFVERYLTDHRDEVMGDEQALDDLVDILEVFLRVGWGPAIQVAYRLDEVFR